MTHDTQTTAPIDPARQKEIDLVSRNLESRLTYLQLYQAATRGGVERDALPALAEIVEEEHDTIARLAGWLRHLGAPMITEADSRRLIAQFAARRGTLDRLEFLRRGIVNAGDWYAGQAGNADLRPELRSLFAELEQLQRSRVQRLEELTNRLRG